VSPDDTIRFRIGDGTRAGIPGCKLRITIHQPENFSKAVLQHSKAQHGSEPLDVEVMPGVAAFAYQPGYVIATYKCELLDSSGNTIPGMASDGASGGEVVPDVAA
jgi:hypothetical protein